MAGTNRGLFVYDAETSQWTIVPGLGTNIIYAVSEDKLQRLLVAAASGFYVGPRQPTPLQDQVFTRLESGSVTPMAWEACARSLNFAARRITRSMDVESSAWMARAGVLVGPAPRKRA